MMYLHLFIPIRHVRFPQMRQSSNHFTIPAIASCRIFPEIIHQEEQRCFPVEILKEPNRTNISSIRTDGRCQLWPDNPILA
ncbi:hypothetical protein HMPREF3039_02296 [Akkermansia sp. KLE1798]|nr:hypothetical protein HMPREF3039_02296 [Akkermansia sp. KLE1798]